MNLFFVTSFFLSVVISGAGKPGNSPGAELAADMKKIKSAYENAQQISLSAKVTIYPEKNGTAKTSTASIKKDGMKFVSVIGAQVTVSNGKMQLLIDKNEKSITAVPAAGKLPDWMNQPVSDSVSVKGITLLKNIPTEKRYSWDTKGTEYSKMEISVDPKTWYVKEVIYEYREPELTGLQKVWITYTVHSVNQPIDKSVFDVSAYVTEKNGKLSPSSNYKNYTLYDYRKQ